VRGTSIRRHALIEAFAQAMGLEAAEALVQEKIELAGLELKDTYSLSELFRVSAILIRLGGLVGVVAQTFTNNILWTLQKDALERAARSEREAEAIFEAANIAIVLFDLQTHQLVDINEKGLELLGVEKRVAYLRSCEDFFVTGSGRRAPCMQLELGESVENVELFMRAETRLIPVLISAKALLYQNRHCLLLSLVDITPIKRVERDLREARHRAEEASAVKSQFLANMSHELRTPMNAVIGFSDLLSRTNLDAEQREYITTIRESSELLLRLISDVLDISKIEAGEATLEQIDFDLHRLARGIVQLLKPKTSPAVLLRLDFAEDAPRRMRGDPTRLRQVLLNLLSNAVKFTDRGYVELAVRSAAVPPEMIERWAGPGCSNYVGVEISVRDTGIGITSDKLSRIFDAFTQADASTTRKYGGTGLGLAISRAFVRMMGGDITVSSRPGEGSCFSFTAFLLPSQSAPPPSSQEHPAVSPGAQPLHGLKLLVAEDNRVNQRLITRVLDQLGCHVKLVANGVLAVHEALSDHYDLCLMDLQMPEMGGLEATSRIREAGNQKLPIIALTASALKQDMDECFRVGMNDFLVKPLDTGQLQSKLQRWTSANAIKPKS
jgi:signal transduction histidine kinase/ActR/RegA family two-component response regulator